MERFPGTRRCTVAASWRQGLTGLLVVLSLGSAHCTPTDVPGEDDDLTGPGDDDSPAVDDDSSPSDDDATPPPDDDTTSPADDDTTAPPDDDSGPVATCEPDDDTPAPGVDADGDAHTTPSDCDDDNPAVHPGAAEAWCNGVDEDCDGIDFDGTEDCPFRGEIATASTAVATFVEEDVYWSKFSGPVDLNGDGLDDIVLGDEESGLAYVFYSPVEGTLTTADADARLSVKGCWYYGNLEPTAVAGAGDMNGDGYEDLLIGQPACGEYDGAAFVAYGPLSGSRMVDLDADGTLVGNGGEYGWDVAGIGDVNGDGLADVAVTGLINTAFILGPAGGTMNLEEGAAELLDTYGYRLDGTGDTNGDAVPDVIIGTHYGHGAVLVSGDLTGHIILPTYALAGFDIDGDAYPCAVAPGGDVGAAGDVNGDGLADMIILDPNWGPGFAGFVKFGPALGAVDLAWSDAMIYDPSDTSGGGENLNGVGDVDGDGFDDLMAGSAVSDYEIADSGAVFLFYGPIAGRIEVTEADAVFVPEWPLHTIAGAVGAGDVNGDGFDDVLVIAVDRSGYDWRFIVYLHHGRPR